MLSIATLLTLSSFAIGGKHKRQNCCDHCQQKKCEQKCMTHCTKPITGTVVKVK